MATATKKKMKFKIVSGSHVEGSTRDGTYKQYDVGDTIESNRDLSKLFLNKFQRVYETDTSEDGLEEMTLKELQNVAENEEIEIAPNSKKQDIISAIRATS